MVALLIDVATLSSEGKSKYWSKATFTPICGHFAINFNKNGRIKTDQKVRGLAYTIWKHYSFVHIEPTTLL